MQKDLMKIGVAVHLLFLALSVVAAPLSLVNSAFNEKGDGGKILGWQNSWKSHFRLEDGAGHNLSRGLVWESETAEPNQNELSQEVFLQPGKCYRYTTLVKTENFKGSADCCIQWYSKPKGGWIGGAYLGHHDVHSGTADWSVRSADTCPIPTNAVRAVIMYYVRPNSSGRVVFDNPTIEPLERDSVAFVFSSAYRDLAAEGEVRFHAALFPPANAQNLKAVFAYTDAKGERHRIDATYCDREEARLVLNVKDMKLGEQNVIVGLFSNGKVIGAATNRFTRVTTLPERKVYIDRFGRFIVHGKPFFPLGLYCGVIDEELSKTIGESPFNFLMPYEPMVRSFFDNAQKHGFYIWSDETWWPGNIERVYQDVKAFKDHPALLGWYTNDEKPLADVPMGAALQKWLRENDPDHPNGIVLDRTWDLREFIPTCDFLGVDPYPIPKRPISLVADWCRGTNKAVYDDFPRVHVVQVFSRAARQPVITEDKRFPTDDELRNMFWQEIALGANGLIGYSYEDIRRRLTFGDTKGYEAQWTSVKRVAGEVKEKFPILLSTGTPPKITEVPDSIVARTWNKDGEIWLLTVNITRESVKTTIRVGNESVSLELAPIGVSFRRLNSGGHTPHEA